MRILIIDDHPDTADAIAMLLAVLGHEPLAVPTGEQGIASVATFAPDVVLLDIGLPDISGYDVARAIRDRPDGDRFHLIAATGWGTPEDRVRALAAGFDQHQLKPLDVHVLSALLNVAAEQLSAASARRRGSERA